MDKNIKIAVAGTGYVGLSIATLLSQHYQVTAVDVIPEKVDLINQRKSPIQDDYIEKYLAEKDLNLTATLDGAKAYSDADFVVIAAPTNYDPVKNYFDTSHVEEVIELVKSVNPHAIMVIKSTIPVGYTESVRKKMQCDNIIFSPEFLRESKALYDNLYPSRIIVGRPEGDVRLDEAAHTFAALLQEGAIKECETLCQHLFGVACQLLQRTGHLRRNERSGHPSHHQRRLPRPTHRHTLQQSLVRLRRLLPAERHQAALGKLCRRARKPDSGDCGKQPYKKRLHCRPCADQSRILQLLQPWRFQPQRGAQVHYRRLPPDDEIEQR